MPPVLVALKMVGSDAENFGCMYCQCNDRERHLKMYFDKLDLWRLLKGGKVLHFAPEKRLRFKIIENEPFLYVETDLNQGRARTLRADAAKLPFADSSFDFLMANHILEHIPEYIYVLKEFYRVLKPGAVAVLQTPVSDLLNNNFYDKNINTDALRRIFYGQEDHVICFSKIEFYEILEKVGFELEAISHDEVSDAIAANYFGVNRAEDLMRVTKPMSAMSI